jgi:hypothetical protein
MQGCLSRGTLFVPRTARSVDPALPRLSISMAAPLSKVHQCLIRFLSPPTPYMCSFHELFNSVLLAGRERVNLEFRQTPASVESFVQPDCPPPLSL